jgi:hypothetical protein
LTAAIQTPEHREEIRAAYRRILAGIDTSTRSGRRARLALLAVEGAFLLRGFGFVELPEDSWNEILDDIRDAYLEAEKDHG